MQFLRIFLAIARIVANVSDSENDRQTVNANQFFTSNKPQISVDRLSSEIIDEEYHCELDEPDR